MTVLKHDSAMFGMMLLILAELMILLLKKLFPLDLLIIVLFQGNEFMKT